MFRGLVSRRMEYLISSGTICGTSAICFLLTRYIGPEAVAFILLLAVSIIAMFFDILPVLLAATLSALIWDYFFLLPGFNFRVRKYRGEDHVVHVFCDCLCECRADL